MKIKWTRTGHDSYRAKAGEYLLRAYRDSFFKWHWVVFEGINCVAICDASYPEPDYLQAQAAAEKAFEEIKEK